MTNYTHVQIERIAQAAPTWPGALAHYYVRFTDDDAFIALNAPAAVAQLLAENAELKARVKEYYDALRKGGYSLIKKHIVHDEGFALSDEELDQLMDGIKQYVAELYGDETTDE